MKTILSSLFSMSWENITVCLLIARSNKPYVDAFYHRGQGPFACAVTASLPDLKSRIAILKMSGEEMNFSINNTPVSEREFWELVHEQVGSSKTIAKELE